jgi:hypothetical protein
LKEEKRGKKNQWRSNKVLIVPYFANGTVAFRSDSFLEKTGCESGLEQCGCQTNDLPQNADQGLEPKTGMLSFLSDGVKVFVQIILEES